ncbi:MAG: MFS transporter [Bacteroidetes bacterium]|nr:MFS transporter [Bacteroidota bacterium]MCC6655843.1 MFS transporter [Flavobacteriales bacterium]HMU12990.1 MFS transporter [Flavobacteriales bacterium]
MKNAFQDRRTLVLVIVASLGYFVDIYDLVLFNVVKKESLEAIGLAGDTLARFDTSLFNWQMGGMLLGGLLWGILGDKRGRVQVLFGSILLYSVANIANAFVTGTAAYSFCRLIAGIGLAGELGAGITLVVESMGRTQRGWGTMIIVTVGALGAVAASFVGKEGAAIADALGLPLQGWQMAYVVGGALGLVLLVLRAGAFESGLFAQVHARTDVTKGDFLALFRTRAIALRYLACIAIGLPVWFAVGVLINKSHVIGPAIGVRGVVHTGTSVMWGYIGLSVGDLFSGLLSQWMRSRRKVILLYLAFQTLCVLVLFFQGPMSLEHFYFMCLMIGISTGFWALFVTVASEQFGTNLRSTVTSTVPNFVRGAVIPITLSYVALRGPWGETAAVLITGGVCIGLSLIATLHVRETFEDDMDFLEG